MKKTGNNFTTIKMTMLAVFASLMLTASAEAATFTVSNTANSGAGSLRQAVLDANALAGADTIVFDATVFASSQTILLSGGQLTITGSVTITGTGADKLTIQNTAAAGTTTRVFNIATASITVNLTGMKITGGNLSGGNGGGVYVNASGTTANITNCWINSNSTASGYGGGIGFDAGTLNLTNSTVSNNTATATGGGGGGIDTLTGTLTVTNSTISGNRMNSPASSNGGGIAPNGTATITNTTITGNSLGGGGTGAGGISQFGTVTIKNTIVAANVGNTTTPDARGAFTSNGYNLIGNRGTATGFTATGDQTGTGAAPINPLLDALVNYGGTVPTHRLQTGSPAIDKGASGTTQDTRGFTRPYDNPSITNATGGNGSDIGAFEVQAPTAANVSVSGRVLVGNGRGLRNTVVTLTDSFGNTHTARTGAFGWFRFDDIAAGQTVIVSVASKRYTFSPQAVNVTDNITDLNFIAGNSLLQGEKETQ